MVSDFILQTKTAIAKLTDPDLISTSVELTNCDREPIHIPAAIQPHGVMLVLKGPTEDATQNSERSKTKAGKAEPDSLSSYKIVQVSQNSTVHLGRPPEDLLDRPIAQLLSKAQVKTIQRCLEEDFEAVNPLPVEIPVNEELKQFAGVVHFSNDVVILELEPTTAVGGMGFFNFHGLVKRPMNRIQQTTTLTELCEVAVQEMQRITGYDRVMVYQLAEDGSGSVVSESKRAEMDSYLGLHYPATDIPKQAKHLYLLNLLRIIPDITYEPVPLVSSSAQKTNGAPTESAPIDMSLTSLRSVSKIHIEYLKNMGVRATLAVSLIRDNRLWGLLVCHHNSPRYLSYEVRTVCEFLGQIIALELNAKSENEDAEYKLKLKAIQAYFLKALPQSESLKEGLTKDVAKLLALTNSTGVAFCEKDEITLLGETPELSEVSGLITWLAVQFEQRPVYCTDSLSAVYAPAARFKVPVGGLLSLAISNVQHLYVLWFRPEVVQTVNWAGKTEKPVEVDERGELRMSPRQSFDLWQETVKGRSLPWKPWEIEAALELRSTVIGLVLQKADELAELNLELTRSNVELDSFAYIASHDLKEPLRGIHNYSTFLIEDYGEVLGEDGVDKLHTLMRLTKRMETLISSLLHYSRLGRAELKLEAVALDEVVGSVIELVKVSKPEAVSFEVADALPVVACDRTQITELYTNLITNAIKYNDKDPKRVEIGYLSLQEALAQGVVSNEADSLSSSISMKSQQLTEDSTIFYVRDNGIGIREKHLESVFRIFRRLHAPKRFGGGTGAGLTIAKKIVERHQGQLWVQSKFGEGSGFYFTLETE